MTTRRGLLRLAGAVPAALLLGACRPETGTPDTPPGPPAELLVIRTTAGLALIDTSDGRAVAGPWQGTAALDATAFAAGRSTNGRETLLEVWGQRGESLYSVTMAGALAARVIGSRGDIVALTSPAAASQTAASPTAGETYRPVGRDRTTIVVAGRDGERARIDLPGCLEPESFSSDGTHLFVLDYLPPNRPDRYRVRVLNIASGELRPLLTRDKQVIAPGAEEEMRGEGRQAVYAATRNQLFTLYTHQRDHLHTRQLHDFGARPGASAVHAFVHMLNLLENYAYCIDLAAPFGHGPSEGHAITMSRGFEVPYVVDTTSGSLAEIEAGGLRVGQIASFPAIVPGHPAAVAIAPDNATLFVGSGTVIHVIRRENLATTATWTIPAPLRGLGVRGDSRQLWVGQPGGLLTLDAASGRTLGSVAAPSLVEVTRVISPT